ncbi:MAG: GNAT family N-acetyltransferase [Chloroflexi bacterium]|nr:GNAT family N-acetyltransferase [Chloroflexota bacterium]
MPSAPVRLTVNDYDAIMTLWKAAGLTTIKPTGRDSREAFETQMGRGIQAVIGIYEGEQLIGLVMATHDTRKGWVNRLAVHPDFRGKGIGGQLVRAAEEYLSSEGIGIYAAMIESDNAASLATFKREGYHVHEDMVYVTKRITDGI